MPIFKQNEDGRLVPGGPDALKKQLEKKHKADLEVKRKAAQKAAIEEARRIGALAKTKKKSVSRGTVKKAIKKIIKKVKGKSNGRQTKTKGKTPASKAKT